MTRGGLYLSVVLAKHKGIHIGAISSAVRFLLFLSWNSRAAGGLRLLRGWLFPFPLIASSSLGNYFQRTWVHRRLVNCPARTCITTFQIFTQVLIPTISLKNLFYLKLWSLLLWLRWYGWWLPRIWESPFRRATRPVWVGIVRPSSNFPTGRDKPRSPYQKGRIGPMNINHQIKPKSVLIKKFNNFASFYRLSFEFQQQSSY